MTTQPLFEISLLVTGGMLIGMVASVLVTMWVLSRIAPTLSADAHVSTRWLDGLRGIAAVSVCLNHAPLVVFSLLLRPTVFGYIWRELVLFGFLGSIGVEIFFCITGMLFAHKVIFAKQVEWTPFFRKRIYRILPAYVAACLLALAIAAWFTWPIKQPWREIVLALPNLLSFGLLQLPVINGFDFVRVLGINWTLAIEWRYYVMLPLVFVFVRDLRWFACAAIAVLAVIDLQLTGKSVWVYFVTGALCAPLMYRQFGWQLRMAGVIVILLVLGAYVKYWEQLKYYGFEHWILMTFLFGSLAIVRPRLLATNLFVALGSVSYSFYLMHSMILVAFFELCRRYAFDVQALTPRHYTLTAGAGLALSAMVSALFYLYIERPFMRIARHRGAAGKPLPAQVGA